MRAWAVILANGSGPTLILDATAAGAFWTETLNVSPGTNYELSFWATSCDTNNGGNTASIQVYLNGVAVGKPLDLPPDYDGSHRGKLKFNSGSATQVTVSLIDLDTADPWNDFAVDETALNATKA